MKKELSDELIKTLQENPSFQTFQMHIMDKVVELDSTTGLEGLENQRAGEEAKIRAKTAQKIMEIFHPIINFDDIRKITKEDIKKREQEVGL